jgi:hypothetical protein
MSERRLRGRIAAKLKGQGLDDLVALLEGIRPQDVPTLRQEAEAMPGELLAQAEAPPRGVAQTTVRALVKAARLLKPDAVASGPHFLSGDGDDGECLEEFLTQDLCGLSCQIGVTATTQKNIPDRTGLLRLAARLMSAAAVMASALDGEPDRETERIAAWLQLAMVEGLLRRLEALLTESLESHHLGVPRDDEDRWATAAMILSGSLGGAAEAVRAERAHRENALVWELNAQGWMRLVGTVLRDGAEGVAPPVEDASPSQILRALVRVAEVWEEVAGQSDGETAMESASRAPTWERVWREASTSGPSGGDL